MVLGSNRRRKLLVRGKIIISPFYVTVAAEDAQLRCLYSRTFCENNASRSQVGIKRLVVRVYMQHATYGSEMLLHWLASGDDVLIQWHLTRLAAAYSNEWMDEWMNLADGSERRAARTLSPAYQLSTPRAHQWLPRLSNSSTTNAAVSMSIIPTVQVKFDSDVLCEDVMC